MGGASLFFRLLTSDNDGGAAFSETDQSSAGLGAWLRTAGFWFGAGVPLGFVLGLVMSTCLVGTVVVDGELPLLGLFLPGQIKGVEMNPNEDLELRELEGPTRGWTGSGGPGASGASGLGLDPGSFGETPVGNVVPVVAEGPEG